MEQDSLCEFDGLKILECNKASSGRGGEAQNKIFKVRLSSDRMRKQEWARTLESFKTRDLKDR